MVKMIEVWGCQECGEAYQPDRILCMECRTPLEPIFDRVASGYIIQFHAKDKEGNIRDIHEITIQEGDDYLGLHIEGFIEDEDIATIEVKLAASDKLFVRSENDDPQI